MSLSQALADVVTAVDATLGAVLDAATGPSLTLHEAMRYAALGGGKRLRPFLVLTTAEICGAERAGALRVAAAVELVHSYSLVHDDLPAMDDDDTRRGRPTVHRRFDEATAILAGDALLTLAFAVLSDPRTHPAADIRCALIGGLAEAAGPGGMVGGQMLDLAAEGAVDPTLSDIISLQARKTGALIGYSCTAGAILARSDGALWDTLTSYARDLGLAYQIADDLLDAEGDAGAVGKAVRKDAGRGKATFVSLLGAEGARNEAERLCESAISRLARLGQKADLLRAVARYVIERPT